MRFTLLSLLLPLAACESGVGLSDTVKGGDDTPSDSDTQTPPGDSDDSATDSVDPPIQTIQASVMGSITLQLYTYDESGDVLYEDWADVYGAYPFGNVFIAAYHDDDETGRQVYDGQTVEMPDADGIVDNYTIPVSLTDTDTFDVYASVDWYVDGLIGNYEPIGTWATPITVVDGDAITSVDMTILVPYYDLYGGGGGCDAVSLSGTATIDGAYTTGNAAALLYDTDNIGPYYASYFTPTADGAGATGDYAVGACYDTGEMNLLGAWDSNANGVIDPDDTWGTYVAAGSNGNPVTVLEESMSGLDLEIPFGEDVTPGITPTVTIRGTVTVQGDLATSPPAEAVTYVVVSRTRPGTDFDISNADNWYDRSSFSSTTMASGSFDYTVALPSNTVAYLWAFVDLDGDGIVNETDEPVGAAFSTSGQFNSGRTNLEDVNFFLADPSSTPE